MNALLDARTRDPIGGEATDPRFIEAANGLLSEAFDLLATPLTPAQLDLAIRELLAVYDYSPTEFLAGLRTRYVEGRLHARGAGAEVAANVEAARAAFDAVERWSVAMRDLWTQSTYDVPSETELVAAQRMDRSLANAGAGVNALLEAARRSPDDAMRRVTARLAQDAAAGSPLMDPNLRAVLQGFAPSVRSPEMNAAITIANDLPRHRANAVGIIDHILSKPAAGPQAA